MARLRTIGSGGQRFIDWFLRSRVTGKITVAQIPNAPLWVFILASAAHFFISTKGTPSAVLSWVGICALGIWAVIEIGWGVNPFRRLLGLVVLLGEVAMRFHSLVP